MVQLPALNTPQFEWVKSRLPHKAQPVPPIFQPEVAARGIYWAAHQKKREVYIGSSTGKAIFGEKIAPGLLDRYLAKIGFRSQQTDEMETPERPNNLWRPVRGEYAAHGAFDGRARKHSWQLWATMHRRAIAAVAGAFAALMWLYPQKKRRASVLPLSGRLRKPFRRAA
jgi:hypothetical protein